MINTNLFINLIYIIVVFACNGIKVRKCPLKVMSVLQCRNLPMTWEILVDKFIVSCIQCILCKVQMNFLIVDLPSRLATMESKPVPAPISSTALSIRFTCC